MPSRLDFATESNLMRLLTALTLLLGLAGLTPARAADFAKEGVAFLQKHCLACHGEKKKNAGVALHTFTSEASLLKNRKLWDSVVKVIAEGEMPPADKPRPLAGESEQFLATINAIFDKADLNAKPDPGRVTIRRLNKTEYANTVRDLVGIDFNPAEDFPADTRPETHKKLLAADPSKPKREQTREIMGRFATKAYRRPATPEEIERLVKFVEATEARGEKYETAIQFALQGVLTSPKFLFRVELDDRPDSVDAHLINEYQLASRLSYFIWASMPDDELFALAAKNQLGANLDAQVKRMLKDPKAATLVDNFVMQWLQLKRLATFAPDQKMFPQFNEDLRRSMIRETQLFFEDMVREDRSILDVVDGRYTHIDGKLAAIYGIKDTKGNYWSTPKPTPGGQNIPWDKFVRVELPADGLRAGILTQASILTVTSNPTRTSPVKRGRWVLEQVLGTPPPPPPPNVPELKEDPKAISSGSLRQRMEEHRKNPACANCHAKMDAMGFALENFDAIGKFRTKDGAFDIDPAGKLPDGRQFQNPQQLKSLLKEKKELIAGNWAEKMLTYALGRGLEYYDKQTLKKIVAGTEKGGYAFSALVTEIVRSDAFRMRRGKTEPAKAVN